MKNGNNILDEKLIKLQMKTNIIDALNIESPREMLQQNLQKKEYGDIRNKDMKKQDNLSNLK